MTLDNKPLNKKVFGKEILVFGSGVSGLIAAYYLTKKNLRVSVVDPFKEPILQTLKVEEGIVELAANSILMNQEVKDILDDLGLEYFSYSDAGKRKYFFRKNNITRWPLNFFESLALIPFFFRFMFFRSSIEPVEKETLKDWSLRVLPLKFYERVFKRALQGVYGPDIDNLSSSLVLKSFFASKSKSTGSKKLSSISFKDGMCVFTDALKKHLKEKGVAFLNEEPEEFDGVRVISTPTHSLPKSAPVVDKKVLERVLYHNISTLTVFSEEQSRLPFSGFGVVFEDEPGVLGLIFNSDLFEDRATKGLVSETWILDGRSFSSQEGALRTVLEVREKMSGESKKTVVKSSYYKSWPKAFPIYDLNLESALSELSFKNDVYYFANWSGSLGIGRMIAKGEEFSELVFKNLDVEDR